MTDTTQTDGSAGADGAGNAAAAAGGDGAGGLDLSWLGEDAPTELRAVAAEKKWETPAAAVQQYADLEKTMGTRVALPGEDADDDAIAAFIDKLPEPVRDRVASAKAGEGVPEDPAAYEFALPEGVEEFGEADTAFHDALRPALKEAGITQDQVAKLGPRWNEIVAGLNEAADAQAAESQKAFVESSKAAIAEKFGGDAEQVQAYMDQANQLFALAAGDAAEDLGQIKLAEGGFLMDHPGMVGLMAGLFPLIAEDGALPGTAAGGGGRMSAADAQAAYDRYTQENSEAWMNRDHPEHAKVVAEAERLAKAAAAAEGK